MRLIDADKLIEDRVGNDPVVIAAKCAPTAYDLSKVLERLENKHINCFKPGDYKYNRAIDDAVEIVRSGVKEN